MEARFHGGPLDGQSNEIGEEPLVGATIYWPPRSGPPNDDDEVPGVDDVVEYLYRGEGEAEYVGGLLDA
jgi:hypothetical protein